MSLLLEYPFFRRALVVGACLALCAALLGVNLVLGRYSMIGDGLSHTAFGALAVAAAMGVAPLYVALPVTMLAAILLLRLGKKSGDTAVALLSVSALAVGVLVLSVRGMNTDVNSYLFGSLLALTGQDVLLCAVLTVLVLGLYFVFYHRLFAVSFDAPFAQAAGQKTGLTGAVLAVLTAAVVVLGMRLMGALLISALILFPALSAMRVFGSYRFVTIGSAVLALVAFAAGLFASWVLNLPTGASIVVANLLVFLLCVVGVRIFAAVRKQKKQEIG